MTWPKTGALQHFVDRKCGEPTERQMKTERNG